MRLLNYIDSNSQTVHPALKSGAGTVDLQRAGFEFDSLDAIVTGEQAALSAVASVTRQTAEGKIPEEWLLDEANLQLAPPLTNPGKIICIGLNYRRHAAESGLAVPETPILF